MLMLRSDFVGAAKPIIAGLRLSVICPYYISSTLYNHIFLPDIVSTPSYCLHTVELLIHFHVCFSCLADQKAFQLSERNVWFPHCLQIHPSTYLLEGNIMPSTTDELLVCAATWTFMLCLYCSMSVLNSLMPKNKPILRRCIQLHNEGN